MIVIGLNVFFFFPDTPISRCSFRLGNVGYGLKWMACLMYKDHPHTWSHGFSQVFSIMFQLSESIIATEAPG